MSGRRAPVVAGVGGGVGTTTLAVALRAHDGGQVGAENADILACRGTLDSLRRAAAVLERAALADTGALPVLAVTLDRARMPRGPVRARLELLEAEVSAVVLLPHVGHWDTVADPLPEVAGLLVDPAPPPRPVRAYAAALRELAGAVAASGRLRTGPVRRSPAGPRTAAGPGRRPRSPLGLPPEGPSVRPPSTPAPPRSAAPAVPPVVGTFRPVVGSVVRTGPPADVAVPAAPEPARRGVRILPAARRPPVPAERIEQVG